MPVPTWRRKCTRCGKGFLTYLEDMVYCNTDCKAKHAYEIQRNYKPKEYNKHDCLSCGGGLNGNRKFCDRICRNAYNRAEAQQERIVAANTREKKPRKKGGLSYEELNRRAEYKRLYDNFHIKRQIRGISRDLI